MPQTTALYADDAYLTNCSATVTVIEDQTIIFDQSIFYPRGGGQPGDTGQLVCSDGQVCNIIDTTKGAEGAIAHLIDHLPPALQAGDSVELQLDWPRRYAHMRMHTALHLLASLIPFDVTGGNISAAKSRLDFDMTEPLDKIALTQQLQALVAADHPVSTRWISEQELNAQPELIRTLSVKPPTGVGRIRLLCIEGVDLQPCGGTHVVHTAEIGEIRVRKIEKKGQHNRRVNLVFDA